MVSLLYRHLYDHEPEKLTSSFLFPQSKCFVKPNCSFVFPSLKHTLQRSILCQVFPVLSPFLCLKLGLACKFPKGHEALKVCSASFNRYSAYNSGSLCHSSLGSVKDLSSTYFFISSCAFSKTFKAPTHALAISQFPA